MKQIFNILLLASVCTSSFTFTSCKETEEIGEYDNWELRNQLYIDSIAGVCEANADGKWVRICAFNLDEEAEISKGEKNHFIYVHKNVEGSGTYKPLYTDTVRAHYSGRLIPSFSYPKGYNFDKSYNGLTLDERTDVPYKFPPNQQTVGFTTALLQMVEGDDWTVYIPNYLGYGSSAQNSVPAYSTLIFDIKMARIYKLGIDTDAKWY